MSWLSSFYKSYVRITHIPTGIETSCNQHRSMRRNRDSAWTRLKSLLYCKEKGIKANNEVIRTYTLPEDDPLPDDLMKYGREIERKAGTTAK